jgi:hypothetical protein
MMAWFKEKKKEEEKKKVASTHNTQAENDLLNAIDTAQQYAEGGKRAEIETDWDDEYKIYIGKQWDTSKGSRTAKGKKRNFNSQDNLVFPMVENMVSAMTSSTPECEFSEREVEDKQAVTVLNDLVPFILYRNNFRDQWKDIVRQGLQYGPFIGYVPFDQHWIGGSGPNRWVGEIRTLFLNKDEFFPDPAILNLKRRMQECSYINLKNRKKLDWFVETWPAKGKHVIEDSLDIPKGQEDEGQEPNQATLITHFHKGVPKFVPDEWKQKFIEKAQKAESEANLPYYAKDLRDMAAGTLKGVHCAYKAGTILLDYVPYVYDDGLYPFVYKVLYADEEQPWGMGEIRNVVIPQILHNKADEIELGAMLGQGLGGGYYDKGSISVTQKEEFLDNIAKPNAWIEVNNKNGIQEKRAVQVPSTISQYKEYKRSMIDVTSQNTDIQKGISPGANVPFATIQELGARGDIRTKAKVEVLEDFLIEFFQLIVNRIAQFYTEDRTYRILGDKQVSDVQREAYKQLQQIAALPQGTPPEAYLQAVLPLLMFVKQQQEKPKQGKFSRGMLVRTWERDSEVTIDESGKEVKKPLMEQFIPEFDLKVRVVDERPTDRNYYSTMALQLFGKAMGLKALWSTLDNGKFPPINEIIEEFEAIQQAQMEAQSKAVQAQILAEQQENEKDRQVGVLKQMATNQSQERMTATAAQAKAGVRDGQ